MLAQNFLSAAELGLSELERDSLIAVLGKMERGELEHDEGWRTPTKPNGFNMAPYVNNTECGTVACIAGWAYLLSDKKAFHPMATLSLLLRRPGEGMFDLVDLFTARMRDDTTPAQAAHALRNYLTIGRPEWDLVFAGQSLIPAPQSITGMTVDNVIFDDVHEYA